MSDRKATNRYYPPEFWDQKGFNDKQNLNSYVGEGWRNRGAQVNSKLQTQGRDVIRFETPFDIVCLGCNEVIHKGVRFNADKRKFGKYFSTTIWEFECKCAKCDHKMFIRTDPENTTYKCEKGCRPAVQGWEEDQDTLKAPDKKEQRRIEADPFYKLEHYAADDGSGRRADEVKAKEMKPVIASLREMAEFRSRDDALLNRALRKGFRTDKKQIQKREREDAAERKRLNLGISLLPASSEDAQLARKQLFGRVTGGGDEDARYLDAQQSKRRQILRAPLFPEGPGGGGARGAVAARKAIVQLVVGGKERVSGMTFVARPVAVGEAGGGEREEEGRGARGESVLDSIGAYGDDSDSD